MADLDTRGGPVPGAKAEELLVCSACGKSPAQDQKLLRCSRCKKVRYVPKGGLEEWAQGHCGTTTKKKNKEKKDPNKLPLSSYVVDGCFIREDRCLRCEPFQGPMLRTGRKPAVGLRTEIQVGLAGGKWAILSGVVTHVGELPTYDQWATTSYKVPRGLQCSTCNPILEQQGDPYALLVPSTIIPLPIPGSCNDPDCLTCQIQRPGEMQISLGVMKDRIHELLGTINGQRVEVFGYLNFDYYYHVTTKPFKPYGIDKIHLICNEEKVNIWTLDRKAPGGGWPAGLYPLEGGRFFCHLP